jgi:hypothetical protein
MALHRDNAMIRFYFRKGRWHVPSTTPQVLAVDWWNAINAVKCMNHRLRTQGGTK